MKPETFFNSRDAPLSVYTHTHTHTSICIHTVQLKIPQFANMNKAINRDL